MIGVFFCANIIFKLCGNIFFYIQVLCLKEKKHSNFVGIFQKNRSSFVLVDKSENADKITKNEYFCCVVYLFLYLYYFFYI